MSETLIDVDVDALAVAAELFGTANATDTVNTALREAAQRLRRLEAVDRLAEMAQAGEIQVLLDKKNYRARSI
ncbi:MAG: DUF2191 domain-containing protein [Actinoplanes sp.]